jgi:hypothetical protein
MGKTVGVKTTVSVPQTNSTRPLKKKERPTVTMITLNTGSPTIGLKKRISVRIPKINPITRVMRRANMNGICQWYKVKQTYAPIKVNSPMARLRTPEHL